MSDATSNLSFAHWESKKPADVLRVAGALVFGVMLFRLFFLLVLPLDLSGDEAYYWEWGRHPDLGYFSKPPGIGWLMALAGEIGGNTTFGIRMFAVFLGTGAAWCLFLLATRMYGPAAGLIAVIAFVANPGNAALNLALTIDAPLMFFWTLSLWAFWEFIQPRANGLKWGAILFLGLAGGILSKQMMLLFPVLALLFLVLSREYRPQLKRPALWVCLLGSLVALAPPLIWNIQNDWLTVKHTMHHFESGSPTFGKRIGRFLEFAGSQLGIITPVLCVLIFAVVFGALRHWKKLGDRERFLWLFCAPALMVMLLMALRQRINANWPAVFYVSATVLVTGWAANQWRIDRKLDGWRRAFRPGLILAIGMTAAVYLLVAVFTFGWVKLPKVDPSARLRGWSTIARDVHAARKELPEGLMVIAQSHRFLASEMSFYLPDQPRVFLYNANPGLIETQHDLWENPSTRLGEDALIIVEGRPEQLADGMKARFESTELFQVLRYPQLRNNQQTLSLFIGRNLTHWPTVHQPSPSPATAHE